MIYLMSLQDLKDFGSEELEAFENEIDINDCLIPLELHHIIIGSGRFKQAMVIFSLERKRVTRPSLVQSAAHEN